MITVPPDMITTTVFVPEGLRFDELKEQDKSIKWSSL